jgi:hypothetical protein
VKLTIGRQRWTVDSGCPERRGIWNTQEVMSKRYGLLFQVLKCSKIVSGDDCLRVNTLKTIEVYILNM